MRRFDFSHPLADHHHVHIRELVGQSTDRVLTASTQFDHARPFQQKVHERVAAMPVTPEPCQTAYRSLIHPTRSGSRLSCRLRLPGGVVAIDDPSTTPHYRRVAPPFQAAEWLYLEAIRKTVWTR